MLISATDEALTLGQPFNRFITIAWERGGIPRRENARATGAFIKLASDWARRHGYRLTWCWVQEWSERTGAHVHLLLHAPPTLDPLFRTQPLRWIKSILPGGYVRRVLDVQRIRGADTLPLLADLYQHALNEKLAYMLKTAGKEAGVALELLRHGEACRTIGKRAARWQRGKVSR